MANKRATNFAIPTTINSYADCPHCGQKILVTAYVNTDTVVSRKCPDCKKMFDVAPVYISIENYESMYEGMCAEAAGADY